MVEVNEIGTVTIGIISYIYTHITIDIAIADLKVLFSKFFGFCKIGKNIKTWKRIKI